MTDNGHMTIPSRLRRFVAALTAWAEAADLDSVTYLDGRVTTLERRIALLEASVRQDH